MKFKTTPFKTILGTVKKKKRIKLKLMIQVGYFVFSTGETWVQSSAFNICGATSWFRYLIASTAKFSIKGFLSKSGDAHVEQSLFFFLFGGKQEKTVWGQGYICATLDLCFSSYPEVNVH